MKQTLTFLLLLLPVLACSQQLPGSGDDSSAAVVDRYLRMMNIEGYHADSMLVMETAVTVFGSSDTLWLRRWFAPANKHRVELWYQGKLTEGMISNGEDKFLLYDTKKKKWTSTKPGEVVPKLSGYDFRGPLYMWRWNGTHLTWNGMSELKGQPVKVVKASRPGMYDRYYMFEAGSGLLTLVMETDAYDSTAAPMKESHIEWKSCHEYLPVGNHLVPSQESFMRNKKLTILSTTAHMEHIRPRIFTRE